MATSRPTPVRTYPWHIPHAWSVGMSDIANKTASVLALCKRHNSIDLRQLDIHRLLGDLEVMLAGHHSWFELTRVQRRQLPAAQPFYDLEDELERLGYESAQLVADLRDLPA